MRLHTWAAAGLAFVTMALPAGAVDAVTGTQPPQTVSVEGSVAKDAPAVAQSEAATQAKPDAQAVTSPDANAANAAAEAAGKAAAEDAAKAAGTALPPDAEVKSVEAKAPEAPPPSPSLKIGIDLSSQKMTVTENGVAKYTWRISSGAYGFPTPTGTFRPVWMSKMWYSRKYDMAPMPHSIFFHGGTAIHATSSVGMLGRPASHGCVRLSPSNAATLYKMVSKHGKALTQISVSGKPNYSAPQIAKRRQNGNGTYAATRRQRYATSYYSYSGPPPSRYVYPGDRPSYYVPNTRRGQNGKPRRYVTRQYAPYGY